MSPALAQPVKGICYVILLFHFIEGMGPGGEMTAGSVLHLPCVPCSHAAASENDHQSGGMGASEESRGK